MYAIRSYYVTKDYYKDAKDIISEVSKIFNINIKLDDFMLKNNHDVPGEWFKGPF